MEIEEFESDFATKTDEAQRMCFATRARELQIEAIEALEALAGRARRLKQEAIDQSEEDLSNYLLSHELAIRALISELGMWVALKDDEPDRAWDSLVSGQAAISAALRAHDSAAHLGRYGGRLHVLEQLLFPKQLFMSPGFTVERSECSICGSEYGRCDHLAGRPYMGRMCVRIIREAKELKEVSLVEEPADKRARAMTIGDEKGQMRHYLSWRVVQEESKDS